MPKIDFSKFDEIKVIIKNYDYSLILSYSKKELGKVKRITDKLPGINYDKFE